LFLKGPTTTYTIYVRETYQTLQISFLAIAGVLSGGCSTREMQRDGEENWFFLKKKKG
jgi:hypothetical protein